MEEKKLTEKESIDLITAMIANTKQHFSRGEGNMLLFWGYLCAIVGVVRFICGYLQYGLGVAFPFSLELIWWIIPVVGIPYRFIVRHRSVNRRNVVTYTDRISGTLWNYVIWLAIATIIIGAVFFISGLNVWYVMMLFSFIVVGMAVSVQGIIIREKPMLLGGGFSVICGGFLAVGQIAGASWLASFTLPLFIISFIVMMIIPGYILNHKVKQA